MHPSRKRLLDPELPVENSDAGDTAAGTGTLASRRREFLEGSVARTLFIFSLPLLGANVLQSLNAAVNSLYVGRLLGEAALGATANANIVLFLLLGVLAGLGAAASILVAQAVGSGSLAEAKRIVATGAALFLTSAVAIAGVGISVAPEILAIMQTPAESADMAADYLRAVFLSLPLFALFSFISMALRGVGDAKAPFWAMAAAVVLDVALNPMLILGLGPLPAMGITGSAIAMLIAEMLSLAGLFAYLYLSRHPLCLRGPDLRLLRPDRAITGKLVAKGLPMAAEMSMFSLSAATMIALVNTYGAQATAAFAVSAQIWTYVQMPAAAISGAVSSMAAQNIGAGRWSRVTAIARWGVLLNLALTGVLVALVYIFLGPLLELFLPHSAAAVEVGRRLNWIVDWSLILMGAAMVLGAAVRASGTVVPPMLLLFAALWLVRLPTAFFASDAFGPDGLWWSFPVGTVAATLFIALYYRFGRWRTHALAVPTTYAEMADTGLGAPLAAVLEPSDKKEPAARSATAATERT